MDDDRVGNKDLLVARSSKRYEIICGRIWHMFADEEQNRGTSRKAKIEWYTWENMDISDGRLYYKVAISRWKRYNLSSLW